MKVDISGLRGRWLIGRLWKALHEAEMVQKRWPTAIVMSQKVHDHILEYLREWDQRYLRMERIPQLFARDVLIEEIGDDKILLRFDYASKEQSPAAGSGGSTGGEARKDTGADVERCCKADV